MTIPSPFQVRPAEPTDADLTFIVSTYDATLPFLASIGNHEQWGSIPFSQRGDFSTETLTQLHHSEENRLTDTSHSSGLRIFIVEREYHDEPLDAESSQHLRIEADGRRYLPVGFAQTRENWVPSYVKSQSHLPIPDIEREEFVYLEVIVTDSRVGGLRRGAGAALMNGIREYGRSRGKRAFWVDSWGGSERRLVRYYENQGFKAVGDWSHERINKSPWLGTLMYIDI
ncbi:uncharacterized protein BO80DRAFT_23031 [Aspergillus ibericus CBS 121593]|uniref:N-acetyltransferase domain-containing protein n=1 Tax=Aspergillus ibericus CBS 121593 TaxID=1448316 RepID=A0A395H5W1_9EURO|nr:hypothetical protein BO80DRAFT_23031 [Aspergillus ibericus CBS 121593]RAL02996.1 hypothetical protein BO80DRAFT_23031 [Aspergillus ibericus CBS 121593]